MDSSENYDKKKLYPVQPKRVVVEDEKGPENGRNDSYPITVNDDPVEQRPKSRRNVVRMEPDLAKGNDHSLSNVLRRASLAPGSLLPSLDHRRQSVFIDYSFYDQLQRKSSMWQDLQATVEEKRTNSAVKEAASAIKSIRVSGIQEMARAGTWAAKLFWLVLFSICCAMLIMEIHNAVRDYKNSPITTTFTIKRPSAITFPDVYICMGNALNRSYVLQHPEIAAASEYIYARLVGQKKRKKRSVYSPEDDYRVPWDSTLEDFVQSLDGGYDADDDEEHFERYRRSTNDTSTNETAKKFANDGEVVYNFLANAGFTVEGTFLQCSFLGYTHRSYNCKQIISGIMDPNYFKCFVVKIPSDEKQVLAKRGLKLLIDTQLSLYPRSVNETKPNKYAGLFVSVVDKFDPTNWYKSVIQPGTFTKISLSATHIQLLNIERDSWSQLCLNDGTKLYRIFNTSYSRTACQMDCLLFAFYSQCKCIQWMDKSLIRKEILDSAPFCAFKDANGCLIPNVTNNTKIMNKVETCRKRCHTPCDSVRYEMRASWSRLNEKAFPGNRSVQDLVQLEVAFGQLETAELVQSNSKTIAQLIADMGGQVNLWLGASMIILLQIPTVIIAYCFYVIYRKIMDSAWGNT